MKKLITIISLILLVAFNNVYASNSTIDFSKKGSLSITLICEENKINGANIEIIKVAEASLDSNSNVEFKYNDKFNSLSKDKLNLKDTKSLLSDINYFLRNNEVDLTDISINKTTNENGNVKFENLDLGLYLVRQTNHVKGYTEIDDYLITIPSTDSDNNWIYDLESLPKTEIEKLIDLTVSKVWNLNNRNSKHPDEVIIEIYNNSELFETVVLNERNQWTIELTQIPYSEGYSVVEVNVPKGYVDTYKNEGFNFTVINSQKLPQTGSLSYVYYIIFALGLLLITTGLIIEKRGNRYE